MTQETLPEALRIAGCLRQAGEQHHISIAVITEAERLIQAQHARINELESCQGCAVQQGYKPAEALQGIAEPAVVSIEKLQRYTVGRSGDGPMMTVAHADGPFLRYSEVVSVIAAQAAQGSE